MSKLHSEQINFDSGNNVEEVIESLQAKDDQFLGATPAALNTLEKLAAAINNDPNFFQTLNTALDGKFNNNGILVSSQVRHNEEALDGFLAVVEANAAEEYIHPGTHPVEMIVGALSATEIDARIAATVDAAPETLNTLNELAAALGDDPNFATTVSNQIGTKLNASAYTAADVLAKLKTVDGPGSGLDADSVDGAAPSATATANSISKRDASGNVVTATKINFANNDGFRYDDTANIMYLIRDGVETAIWHAGNHGEGSGLNADLLDGKHASEFLLVTGKAADANLLDGLDGQYYRGRNYGGSTVDPNTTTYPFILTNHANSPSTSVYWHIRTQWYSTISSTGNCAQIAIQYNGGPSAYVRNRYNNTWTAWKRIDNNAADILTQLKTVDGSASGLDADMVDGVHQTSFMRKSANSHLDMNNYEIQDVSYVKGRYGTIARSTDEWLRLNDGQSHTTGIYCGTSLLRTDGQLQVGSSGGTLLVNGATFKHQNYDVWTKKNLSTATQMKILTKSFPAGASSHVQSDSFIVEATCKVDIVPQGTPAGTWSVTFANGTYTVTSSSAEPSAVSYKVYITKII